MHEKKCCKTDHLWRSFQGKPQLQNPRYLNLINCNGVEEKSSQNSHTARDTGHARVLWNPHLFKTTEQKPGIPLPPLFERSSNLEFEVCKKTASDAPLAQIHYYHSYGRKMYHDISMFPIPKKTVNLPLGERPWNNMYFMRLTKLCFFLSNLRFNLHSTFRALITFKIQPTQPWSEAHIFGLLQCSY